MSHQSKSRNGIRSLRGTLGQFPTGVAIVTTLAANHKPVGMTINSFNSISLTPALVSWCIDHRAVSYETFAKSKSFAITVLAEDQTELAMRFATQGANKFQGIEPNCSDAPVIPNGCAWFKCQTYHSILLGDHTMMVGKVIEFEQNPIKPLVFQGGHFQQLLQSGDAENRTAA